MDNKLEIKLNKCNKINVAIKKSLSKYKELSLPVKASMWYTICSILQRGISLLTIPIFTRLLTQEQYGTFTVYQSWFCIISIFATLEMSSGVYNNVLTKNDTDKSKATSSVLGLMTCLTMCISFVILLNLDLCSKILGLSKFLIIIMIIEIIFQPAYMLWMAYQRYDYKYKNVLIVVILNAILIPLIGIVFVLLSTQKSEARILSYVLIEAGTGLLCYFYIMKKGKKPIDFSCWKYCLIIGLPLLPHFLSTTILAQADRIMISKMIGNSEAAIYSIAYTVSSLMLIVVNAIIHSFTPYIYKYLKSNQGQEISTNVNRLILGVGIFCMATMLLGPEIIAIVGGNEYMGAKWVIPPVATSVFFLFLYQMYCNIEIYYESTKSILICAVFTSGLNVILNYLFIPKFGFIAAAYTTLICYITFSLLHFIFYKIVITKYKCIGIYDDNSIFIISLFMLIGMIIMIFLYNFNYIRISLLCISCMIIMFNWRKCFKLAISLIDKKH